MDAEQRERQAQGAKPGEAAPRAEKRLTAVNAVFIVVALVIVLIPFIGAFALPEEAAIQDDSSSAPALTNEDGSLNVSFLSDAGTYFENHFGLRNELITLDAKACSALLGVAPTDQVVEGTDGWLYYQGTLADYQGTAELTDRDLENIAHNLSMVQAYCTAHHVAFAFTIAPNKNTLYADNMPYYVVAGTSPHNMERLVPYLEEYGVNYVDLLSMFRVQTNVCYLKTDSHWNNRGALLAANELLGAVGRDGVSVDRWTTRADRDGDIMAMLYPTIIGNETEDYAVGINDGEGGTGDTWAFAAGSSVTDSWVETSSQTGSTGTLLMFRDSFGNALIPYLSASYGSAYYSKLIPYNISKVTETGADTLVIERAERHLPYLAQTAPLMVAPQLSNEKLASTLASAPESGADGGALSAAHDGDYVRFDGTFNDEAASLTGDTLLLVTDEAGTSAVYAAFNVSDEETDAQGFTAYVPAGKLAGSSYTVRVAVRQGDALFGVQTYRVSCE